MLPIVRLQHGLCAVCRIPYPLDNGLTVLHYALFMAGGEPGLRLCRGGMEPPEYIMTEQEMEAYMKNLFRNPVARKTDPATSQDAAASHQEKRRTYGARIVRALRKRGWGCTRDDIQEVLTELGEPLTGWELSKRLSDLKTAGLIYATGWSYGRFSGHKQTTWELTPEGVEYAATL